MEDFKILEIIQDFRDFQDLEILKIIYFSTLNHVSAKTRNYNGMFQSEDLRFRDLATEIFERFPVTITRFMACC